MDIKKEVWKIIENSRSAGEMFRRLILGKSYEEKYYYVEAIIYFASINNKNTRIKIKALAYIKFLKEMSIDPVWDEGKIINEFTNIKLILEQNLSEIMNMVETSPADFINNNESVQLCQEILTMLNTYIIDKKLFYDFKSLLINNLDLSNKNDQGKLSPKESFIYNNLLNLSQSIYERQLN